MKREETFVLLISYLCKNYWKYMPKRLESCISFNITSSTAFYNPIALKLRPSWQRKLVLEKKNKGHITSLIISRTPMFENSLFSVTANVSYLLNYYVFTEDKIYQKFAHALCTGFYKSPCCNICSKAEICCTNYLYIWSNTGNFVLEWVWLKHLHFL